MASLAVGNDEPPPNPPYVMGLEINEYWIRELEQYIIVYRIETITAQQIFIREVGYRGMQLGVEREFFLMNYKFKPKPSIGEWWWWWGETTTDDGERQTHRFYWKVTRVVPQENYNSNIFRKQFVLPPGQEPQRVGGIDDEYVSNLNHWMMNFEYDSVVSTGQRPLESIYQTRHSIQPTQFIELVYNEETGSCIHEENLFYRELKPGAFHLPMLFSDFQKYFIPVSIENGTMFIKTEDNTEVAVRNLRRETRTTRQREEIIWLIDVVQPSWPLLPVSVQTVNLTDFLRTHILRANRVAVEAFRRERTAREIMHRAEQSLERRRLGAYNTERNNLMEALENARQKMDPQKDCALCLEPFNKTGITKVTRSGREIPSVVPDRNPDNFYRFLQCHHIVHRQCFGRYLTQGGATWGEFGLHGNMLSWILDYMDERISFGTRTGDDDGAFILRYTCPRRNITTTLPWQTGYFDSVRYQQEHSKSNIVSLNEHVGRHLEVLCPVCRTWNFLAARTVQNGRLQSGVIDFVNLGEPWKDSSGLKMFDRLQLKF